MTKTRSLCLAALLMTTAACTSLGVPALRIDASETDREELRRVIAGALGTTVVIGRDAFTANHRVGFGPPMNSRTAAATGRLSEPPAIFELRSRGGRCYLVHADTGETYSLASVRCRVIER